MKLSAYVSKIKQDLLDQGYQSVEIVSVNEVEIYKDQYGHGTKERYDAPDANPDMLVIPVKEATHGDWNGAQLRMRVLGPRKRKSRLELRQFVQVDERGVPVACK